LVVISREFLKARHSSLLEWDGHKHRRHNGSLLRSLNASILHVGDIGGISIPDPRFSNQTSLNVRSKNRK
jgi:hypothetical protein